MPAIRRGGIVDSSPFHGDGVGPTKTGDGCLGQVDQTADIPFFLIDLQRQLANGSLATGGVLESRVIVKTLAALVMPRFRAGFAPPERRNGQ